MAALEQRKRVLIFPRSKKLQEVTNDHQMATARHCQQQGQIRVALDAAELESKLDLLLTRPQPESLAPFASEALIGRLRQFLFSAS
jgi:UDP-N-acetylglucosamine transferase subunit ALG13